MCTPLLDFVCLSHDTSNMSESLLMGLKWLEVSDAGWRLVIFAVPVHEHVAVNLHRKDYAWT